MSTIPAPARRGLIPAVSGLFSAVSRPASRINLDRIAIGLVFFAGVVTILKKNGVDVPSFMVLFGCSLGIAGLLPLDLVQVAQPGFAAAQRRLALQHIGRQDGREVLGGRSQAKPGARVQALQPLQPTRGARDVALFGDHHEGSELREAHATRAA